MEEKPRTVLSNGLYYGLITGVAIIIYYLVMFLLDLYLKQAVSWIADIVLAGGMVWGTLEFRKKYSNGFLTYGKAFISCFWIGLFAGIIGSLYGFVFAHYIHPGFTQELLDQIRANMIEKKPDMPDDQLEQAMAMTSKFMTPVMMIIWSLVMYTVSSAVIALILAIFLKKEDKSLNATM
jgi:hypothetical protein